MNTVDYFRFLERRYEVIQASRKPLELLAFEYRCLICAVYVDIFCKAPQLAISFKKIGKDFRNIGRCKRHTAVTIVVCFLVKRYAFAVRRDPHKRKCYHIR